MQNAGELQSKSSLTVKHKLKNGGVKPMPLVFAKVRVLGYYQRDLHDINKVTMRSSHSNRQESL